MLLDLKSEIIYGPVRSRRLGRSLGINILPQQQKACTFDCLYCQYGWAGHKTLRDINKKKFPGVSEVLSAVKQAVQNLPQPAAYLTFSGNGEATLHPDFKKIVEGVMQIRDKFSPSSKTAILSNSTTVNDEVVREALALLDVPVMKLDAGTEEMFVRYNRPARGITLTETVTGLTAMGNVTVQALFTKGPEGNFIPGHLNAWLGQIKKISPIFVQLYSLDRSSPSDSIHPLDKSELMQVHSMLEQEGVASGVY